MLNIFALHDTSAAMWGFTVVHRMKPTAGRRGSMYVYLAPEGEVPRFHAETISVLPEKRTGIRPRPYASALQHGSCIKLYNCRWKARSIATTEARYELERYLHSPCLPFRLTETRDYFANYFSTTISGVWVSVDSNDDTDKGKVESNFPAYALLQLRGIGKLPYRIVVFKEEVSHRHVPRGFFFTVNKQVHGGLPADFISRRPKFDYLKDHLLVSVDCTSINATVREDFFMASRDRVRKNEAYDLIVDELEQALREHPGLREINAARRKKDIERHISDRNETATFFNELLRSDPALSALFNLGDQLVTRTGLGTPVPFVGQKFPTYFRLAKNPREGLLKKCPINRTTRIEFETDVVNDYFSRSDSPGRITTDPPNLIEQSHLWNGAFTARFRTPWDAKPGDSMTVNITVEDVQTETRGKPFVSAFTMLVSCNANMFSIRAPVMPEIGASSRTFRQYRDTGSYNYLRYTTLESILRPHGIGASF